MADMNGWGLYLTTRSGNLEDAVERRRRQLERLDAEGPRPRRRRTLPEWFTHPIRSVATRTPHRPAAA